MAEQKDNKEILNLRLEINETDSVIKKINQSIREALSTFEVASSLNRTGGIGGVANEKQLAQIREELLKTKETAIKTGQDAERLIASAMALSEKAAAQSITTAPMHAQKEVNKNLVTTGYTMQVGGRGVPQFYKDNPDKQPVVQIGGDGEYRSLFETAKTGAQRITLPKEILSQLSELGGTFRPYGQVSPKDAVRIPAGTSEGDILKLIEAAKYQELGGKVSFKAGYDAQNLARVNDILAKSNLDLGANLKENRTALKALNDALRQFGRDRKSVV